MGSRLCILMVCWLMAGHALGKDPEPASSSPVPKNPSFLCNLFRFFTQPTPARVLTPREQAQEALIKEASSKPGARQTQYRTGWPFWRYYPLPDGTEVLATARVTVQGRVLRMWDFQIMNRGHDNIYERVPTSPEWVRGHLKELMDQARELGFEVLVIEGTRMTGSRSNVAKPDIRTEDLTAAQQHTRLVLDLK